MTGTAILIHGGESVRPKYEAALARSGLTFHVFYKGGFSSSYQSYAEAHTLEQFLDEVAPEWNPGDPLVLIGFSAGCWAPRHWMQDASSRSLVSALVLLDGMHSSGNDQVCNTDKLSGIFAFADMAKADPSAHLLVVTNTDIVPPGYASTSACAEALLEYMDAPEGSKRDEGEVAGVVVIDEGGTDAPAHGAQQTVVGPAVLEELVVPFLSGKPVTTAGVGLGHVARLTLGFLIITGLAWAVLGRKYTGSSKRHHS